MAVLFFFFSSCGCNSDFKIYIRVMEMKHSKESLPKLNVFVKGKYSISLHTNVSVMFIYQNLWKRKKGRLQKKYYMPALFLYCTIIHTAVIYIVIREGKHLISQTDRKLDHITPDPVSKQWAVQRKGAVFIIRGSHSSCLV